MLSYICLNADDMSTLVVVANNNNIFINMLAAKS